MARVLITGDRGFFGSRFHSLYDSEHTVLGIDKDDVDITDSASVDRCFADFVPELVIHAAAITDTAFSDQHPGLTERINVDGALHVARATQAVKAKLIFFSTEQIFNGNEEAGPYAESDTPRPNTKYGATKWEAEQRLTEIMEELWILRFTWLFGLPERNMPVNPNVLWNTVSAALTGKRIKVATNEYRGHTYGYDMLKGVMKVPEIPYGTYHIGSVNDIGRYDLSVTILEEMGIGYRAEELLEPDSTRYAVPRDVRLDTSKIASQGIRFDDSAGALTRALAEFGLHRLG
mgnify:CR=1 FL=1